jgi:hypothetical protein
MLFCLGTHFIEQRRCFLRKNVMGVHLCSNFQLFTRHYIQWCKAFITRSKTELHVGLFTIYGSQHLPDTTVSFVVSLKPTFQVV